MSKLSRRQVASAGFLLPIVLTGIAAADDVSIARRFIDHTGDRVVSILRAATPPATTTSFLYALVRRSVAIDYVGISALGIYRHSISRTQRSIYLALFHRAVYLRLAETVSMVTDPTTISFRITGIASDGTANLVKTAIHQGRAPVVAVAWRVGIIAGSPKIIDVLVEGISMLKTVRADYTSVIYNHGDSINGLIAALRRQVHGA